MLTLVLKFVVRKEGQQSKDAICFRMKFIFVASLRVVQGLRVGGGLKVGLFPWFICKLIKFRGYFRSKIFKAISTLFLVAINLGVVEVKKIHFFKLRNMRNSLCTTISSYSLNSADRNTVSPSFRKRLQLACRKQFTVSGQSYTKLT